MIRDAAGCVVIVAAIGAAGQLIEPRPTTRVVEANAQPARGELGAHYFDTSKESQIWVNLEPRLAEPEPGPDPVILNVTVAFPGKEIARAPERVVFRAESRCYPIVFPLRVRQPVLRFVVDRTTIDLTGEGASFRFVANCSEGPLDTVIAPARFEVLRQIAGGIEVAVEALGFSLRLTPADRNALGLLVRTVQAGVRVR